MIPTQVQNIYEAVRSDVSGISSCASWLSSAAFCDYTAGIQDLPDVRVPDGEITICLCCGVDPTSVLTCPSADVFSNRLYAVRSPCVRVSS